MKYWYYIDLGVNVYDVVYSYDKIDIHKDYMISCYTNRNSKWNAKAGNLSLTRLDRMKIPNTSSWISIEQARREGILNKLIN